MAKPFRVVWVATGRCTAYRDYATYAYWSARGAGQFWRWGLR